MAHTLDDLAALTGVSRATVSRVINGGPVADETREKVLAALEETNYRPNVAARSLASGRTGVMGVVMHVDAGLTFSDFYFSQLLTGISDQLSEQSLGMMLWLGERNAASTVDQIVGMRMLDGVIVTADTKNDPVVDGLRAADIPLVLVGHRKEDSDASYVDIDNIAAADVATSHLLALGRTRIGHITGRLGSVSADDRVIGYQQAMQRAGLPTEGLLVEGDYTPEGGHKATQELIAAGADAIFASSDYTARGALRALMEAGLSVPDDVALMGFDDLEFAAELDPPLTTIRQNIYQIGHEAARSLVDLIEDPDMSPRRILQPTELVVRQSTAGEIPAYSRKGSGA